MICSRPSPSADLPVPAPSLPRCCLTQWIFYLFGMMYGFNTYFHAAKVRGLPSTLIVHQSVRPPVFARTMTFHSPCSAVILAPKVCSAHILLPAPPALQVYIESYHTVPKGHCRLVVRVMALFFFAAWTMYPLLFALGPEGLNVMNGYQSTICTTVADILAKQLWGLLGHHLRVKVGISS